MNALTTRAAGAAPLAGIGDMMRMADMLAGSAMVPGPYKGKPQDILVALLWGNEVGLGPIQALNGISVINGKPALWGDAALALVRGHPACAGIREGIEGEGDTMTAFCEVTRRGQTPERRTFSVADARKAGLWGKAGPWQQYPARMLQMRARGFAIRDVFPDALRGVITAEEAQDMLAPRDVPNLAAEQPVPDVENEPTREKAFTLRLLDDQLAQFHELDEIKGYLEQPKVKAAYWRAVDRAAGDKWSAIVQAHIARVSPEDRDAAEPEPEQEAEQ